MNATGTGSTRPGFLKTGCRRCKTWNVLSLRLRVGTPTLGTAHLDMLTLVGATGTEIDKVDKEMSALNSDLKYQEISMIQKASQVKGAMQRYQEVLEVHEAREAKLKDYSARKWRCLV